MNNKIVYIKDTLLFLVAVFCFALIFTLFQKIELVIIHFIGGMF